MKTPKAIKIDNTHFILQEDYSYTWMKDGANASDPSETYKVESTIIVNKGFRWDGASIPKLFWSWGFTPDGKYRAAALVHDFIYIYKGKLPKGSMISNYISDSGTIEDQIQYGSFSRKDADRLFGKMMKENQVAIGRRKIMKYMVMKFGWIYWKDGPYLMTKTLVGLLSFALLVAILLNVIGVF
ncbi:MAG: DUF1353 domain-containing protein [Bacteroidales bacterium]|nr:DUF1353 domain-containing protein [Bacteroidales bacterium]